MGMNNNLNIIYIVASEKGISGGEKVIYRHSEKINKLSKNITSEIIPLEKKRISKYKNFLNKILNINKKYSGWTLNDVKIKTNHKTKFFDHNPKFRKKFDFNKKTDFVILPEIFAHLANDLLIKAYAVLLFTLVNLFLWIFLLTITESDSLASGKMNILQLIFEEFSAFSTVGLSMGITSKFSDAGLIILSLSMFIGRLGTLMLIMALSKKVHSNKYKYPDAHIMIG